MAVCYLLTASKGLFIVLSMFCSYSFSTHPIQTLLEYVKKRRILSRRKGWRFSFPHLYILPGLPFHLREAPADTLHEITAREPLHSQSLPEESIEPSSIIHLLPLASTPLTPTKKQTHYTSPQPQQQSSSQPLSHPPTHSHQIHSSNPNNHANLVPRIQRHRHPPLQHGSSPIRRPADRRRCGWKVDSRVCVPLLWIWVSFSVWVSACGFGVAGF